jgi:signal transduction histidine kinase
MALRSEVSGDGFFVARPAVLPATGGERARALLSTMPAGPRERRLALALAVLSTLAFAAMVPYARVQLAKVSAFIPAYESALFINDAITAILLLGQFLHLRSRALLLLAAGYLFDALIIVPHLLSYPDVFSATGLLGAGPQTTAWLYSSWHGLFPVFVTAYALLTGSPRWDHPSAGGRDAAIAFGAVALLVVLVTLVTTHGQAWLPGLMEGIHYSSAMKFVMSAVWVSSLVALAALLAKRPRSVIDTWLTLVICAWIYDVGLSAVFNAGRYDLGFYAGRAYGLLAASFVLAVMLIETSGLYSRLAQSNAQLADEAKRLQADVTSRASAQEQVEAQLRQAQKMEAIGNLTGGMAHDFNNLLAVIIGNLDTLVESRKDDAEIRELAGDSLEAAIHGADLTQRLLAFARRQPLQPRRIALNELVSGITKLLARTLGENIAITLDLHPSLWPVIADPAQLEAALTNLATNARDAMPGGGALKIATRNQRLDADYAAEHAEVNAGDFAMIEVSDSGTGIAPETLERIFEPFFTTKDQGKGTGLGLSMVYGFMKQSQGHINVYSELGIGTTFRLYLPRAEEDRAAAAAEAAAQSRKGQGETVLVVEDNASLRRVVVRQLGELGYRALEADSAANAVTILESEPVDLLFTDVIMTGVTTGIELARSARERWPGIRVVLTSGFPEVKANGAAPSMEARLLNKPYRREDLAKALRETLDT